MTIPFRIMISLFSFVIIATTVNAADFEFTGRFGGTVYTPSSSVEWGHQNGSAGGAHQVAVDISGPATVWELHPFISYEYHWSGGGNVYPITTQSDIYSLGIARPFAVGYARMSLSIGIGYFADSFDIIDYDEKHVYHQASSWGMNAGLDFKFKFFDHLDAVVGYKYFRCNNFVFEPTIPTERTYTIEGRSAEHSIFAGVCFLLGDT